jgi:hypothetical protein
MAGERLRREARKPREFTKITGISNRVLECQQKRPDHVFPFKDFLVQSVCSYYLDVGESLAQTKDAPIDMVQPISAALLPLQPVRAIELIVVAIHFDVVCN